MRLSTSTNIYFNRPGGAKASIQDSMRQCAQAGYRVMDLNFLDCTTFRFPFVTDEWRHWLEDIAALARQLGIVFSQAHAPFYNFCDPAYPNAAQIDALILRAIDCCKVLHIPWMVIHAGTDFASATPSRSSYEKNRAYFLPVLEYAAKQGVGIAFENLWECPIAPRRRYTSFVEEVLELTDSFGGAQVGVCWDTDHAALMQQDQPQALALLGKRLVATHISDCLSAEADHMLPFMGMIDWPSIMDALAAIHYTGDFTYEIHRYTITMPDWMVPDALKFSVTVGNQLLGLSAQKETK